MFHQHTLSVPPRPHRPFNALVAEQQSLEEHFSVEAHTPQWSLIAFFVWMAAAMISMVQQG